MTIKKNLDVVIFEKLKEEIIAGRWKQDQQILIDELADYFGVSRTPVIQAAKMMAAEGMFNIRSNGRIEIPSYDRQQVIDVFKVRLVLEDFALRTICEQKSSLEMQKLNELAQECAKQQNVYHNTVESRKLDLRLHRHIVESTGNECLRSSYARVQGQFTVANYLLVSHSEQRQSKASDEHFEILEHLKQYDYIAAKQALEHHIMEGCRRVIDRIEAD